MDSCFPPLAALSLRDKKSSGGNNQKGAHRHSAGTISGPMKAPGKLDILQDLDLYYIRQIAHNLKEYDLEQKIELEIRMREGTARLLRACHSHHSHHSGSGSPQAVEAAKNLLASDARMAVYTAELQTRKRDAKPRDKPSESVPLARLSVSELRLPLMWRDSDHFKNRGDHRRFAVFCLVRAGADVQDTSLLYPVDRAHTDLTFPDTLLFSQVSADFSCRLEVYSHELQDDLSIASAPRRIKRTIHSSISRTVGKRLASVLKDESNHSKIGPQFELVATATLHLKDVDACVRTHDLVRSCNGSGSCNTGKSATAPATVTSDLPLFGHFCARVALLPECRSQPQFQGGVQHANATWAVLQDFCLNFFISQDQCNIGENPVLSIPTEKSSRIQINPSNPREIQIKNIENAAEEITSFRLRNQDECRTWYKALIKHSEQQELWGPAGQGSPMYIPTPDSKNLFRNITGIRQCSLYDETPISASATQHQRPSIHDVFNFTPQPGLNSCIFSGDSFTADSQNAGYNSMRSTSSNCSTSTNASSKSSSSEHSLNYDMPTNNTANGTKSKNSNIKSRWPFLSKNYS